MSLLQGSYAIELDPDIFDEDQSDVAYLKSKPGCFIVVGPPGSGKSLAARMVAQFWKCLLVTPETVAVEALKTSGTAAELKECLHTKDGIPETVVFDLLKKKLESKEAHHYGYVLDDFPTPEFSVMNLDEQFNFLRGLEMTIDFVIVIRFPLEDAVRRKEVLYFHSATGMLIPEAFINEVTDYQETTKGFAPKLDADEALPVLSKLEEEGEPALAEDGEAEENAEDGEEEEENKKPGKKARKGPKKQAGNVNGQKKNSAARRNESSEMDDSDHEAQEPVGQKSLMVPLRNTKRTTFGHMHRRLKTVKSLNQESVPDDEADNRLENIEDDILLFRQVFFPDVPLERGKLQFPNESLFLRIEDSVEWTQEDYLDYKKLCLPYIENFMASYYPLRVIEIDGHTPLHQIPRLIMTRLECMRLQKPPIPHPLTDLVALQRIQEEVPELEKQYKQALLVGAMSPRWKWRKSAFGTYCPVSMMEGLMIPGVLPFATVFLDRLYFLADKPQQERFILNPRLYILPPNPRVPTRFVIFGAQGSGKTNIAHLLGDQYEIRVIDVKPLTSQVEAEQKDTFLRVERKASTIKVMETMKASLEEELQRSRTVLEAPAVELKNLKPDSIALEQLKDILDINRASLAALVDGLSAETASPVDASVAVAHKSNTVAADPSVTVAPPTDQQSSMNESLGKPEPDQTVPGRTDESTLGTESSAVTDQSAVSPFPEVAAVRVLTEAEQQRVVVLEALLTQLRTDYLAQQTELRLVNDSFPAVLAEVERLMTLISPDSIRFDSEHYVALLKETIAKSAADGINLKPERNGSWVLDNLTMNTEVIALVLELPELIRPTDIVFIKDSSEKFSLLRNTYNVAQLARDPAFMPSDELWDQQASNIAQLYTDLAKVESAVGNIGLRIHSQDLSEKLPEAVVAQIGAVLVGLLKQTVVEYVEPEADENENDEEEENKYETSSTMFNPKNAHENSEKSRPTGETTDFCPVALKEFTTLWPGNPENGFLMYKDKIYSFSTPEAKDKFTKDPDSFLPVLRPPSTPPLRILVMGIAGSGKTTHAKAIAQIIDGFVINMRTYMNELATPKLQKPPVETFTLQHPKPYWRRQKIPLLKSEILPIVDKQLPAGLVPAKLLFLPLDPAIPLVPTPEEQACADSLTADSSLPADILTGFFNKLTKEPPFAGRNLVFDGFPMYPDDARFLLEKGIIPDAVFVMSLDSEIAAERLLPKRKEHWMQEKGKKGEKQFNSYFNKHKEWENNRAARKAELVAEQTEAKRLKDLEAAARNTDAKFKGEVKEVPGEESEEEVGEHLEQQLEDELPEPKLDDEQGAEELEDETSAAERLDDELHEHIDKDSNNVDEIKEIFEDKKIPVFEINSSRSELVARKKWRSILLPLLKKRQHLFETAFPVSGDMAKEMLDSNFKRLGKFGTWCPVKIRKGHLFPPPSTKVTDLYPVLYRQCIYLCSTKEARTEFVTQPEYFVRQQPPRLCIPIRLAVIGPPKSGKTTFAKRLAEEAGIRRISIGHAIRYVQSTLKKSELCRILTVYLTSGTDVPDSLEILCLEALLRTIDCQARGWILDGYPSTVNKLSTMMQRFIIPSIVFELVASNKVCVFRSVIENMTTKKLRLPIFNNSQVVATRLAHYKIGIPQMKSYLQNCTRNLVEVDASASKWKMWYDALEVIANGTILVQNYVERREKRLAAPLTGLCVTPHQLLSRLSDEYRVYCPVTYNKEFILFDCLVKQTIDFIAEYKEKYYLFATREKLDIFLLDPERWLPPQATRTVPPRELLPRIVRLDDLEKKWSERVGFGGMCPVTYYEHNCMTTGLVYGSAKWIAEYEGKIYQFCSLDCLDTFLGQPQKYRSLTEPTKRPPQPEHPSQLNLEASPLPYLESKLGPLLLQAILEVSELRPKYPQIGYKESALLFVANYLKHAKRSSSADIRSISLEKLRRFAEVSELAAEQMLNVQSIPEFAKPGPQHAIFGRMEELKQVCKELQDDWHTLCPF